MRLALCLLLLGCRAAAPGPTLPATTVETAARTSPEGAAPEIGSLRNARVALPRSDGAPLVYFAREASEEQRGEIERVAPRLRVVTGLSREEALARAAEVHGVDAFYATPEFLRAAHKLVWVQAMSAGVERYLAIAELAGSERIVLTNMRGVHGPAIADHAFAMLLALTRDLPIHLAGRASGAWNPGGSGVLTPIALQGRTLLVVGLGGIGTEIARRGHGFGMRVVATRRSKDPAPAFVDRVAGPGELLALLPEADVVAIAVPLTAETERMFDRAAFAAMKPKSYIINVARGKIVDSEALLEAVRAGKLAGACLDVSDPEPLPPDHALWTFPNVIITPHSSSDAELTEDRRWALLRENLRRFDAGEPLLNVVDPRAGY